MIASTQKVLVIIYFTKKNRFQGKLHKNYLSVIFPKAKCQHFKSELFPFTQHNLFHNITCLKLQPLKLIPFYELDS